MPNRPQGQECPADMISNAVRVAMIATGKIKKTASKQPTKRKSSLAGMKARQENTTEAQCGEIAHKAENARLK